MDTRSDKNSANPKLSSGEVLKLWPVSGWRKSVKGDEMATIACFISLDQGLPSSGINHIFEFRPKNKTGLIEWLMSEEDCSIGEEHFFRFNYQCKGPNRCVAGIVVNISKKLEEAYFNKDPTEKHRCTGDYHS